MCFAIRIKSRALGQANIRIPSCCLRYFGRTFAQSQNGFLIYFQFATNDFPHTKRWQSVIPLRTIYSFFRMSTILEGLVTSLLPAPLLTFFFFFSHWMVGSGGDEQNPRGVPGDGLFILAGISHRLSCIATKATELRG